MRKGILLGAAAFAVFCSGAAQAHRDPFTILSVPGASTTQGGVFPQAISGKSVITGYYNDDNGVYHGFIGTAAGGFTSFDAPGAGTTANLGTEPAAINAYGVVAGSYDDGVHQHGFVRQTDGTFETFQVVADRDTTVRAISNKGSVIGTANLGGYLRKPNGRIETINVANASSTFPIAINAGGTIAGQYYDSVNTLHGFVRTKDGTITTFDAPDSFTDLRVAGIDAAGDIAGYVSNNAAYVGFVRSAADGTITTFIVPECPQTFVSGMNTTGTVVGNCFSNGDFTYHGFTRTPDGTITQYDGPNAGTGGAGTFPTAISSNAKSVGYTESDSGLDTGYLLAKPGP